MIKSELVARLSERYPHLYHRDVERIVSTVLDEITKALADGDRVELRGFGAFSVKVRPARQGRNPRTGEAVSVHEKRVPFFRTGKELRERPSLQFELPLFMLVFLALLLGVVLGGFAVWWSRTPPAQRSRSRTVALNE